MGQIVTVPKVQTQDKDVNQLQTNISNAMQNLGSSLTTNFNNAIAAAIAKIPKPVTPASGGIITDWSGALVFTPSAGFGSTTNTSVWSRRVGDSLEVRGSFVLGTVAGTSASIGMPSGYVIDGTKLPSFDFKIGEVARISNSAFAPVASIGPWVLYYDGSSTGSVFVSYIANNQSTYLNGVVNEYSGAGDTWQFQFLVPIVGWS